MPRVKIDYVVSFSSEDPENQADNLLAWDVSKKRWLCPKGEPSCSVVLQLAKAVKISAVHIGAHHTALVEVLVGRSETPNDPFQVLVPSCVFLTPAESRRDEQVQRVRSFTDSQLGPAAQQRWDRLRLVCSQPYNKHCKYGLNFVQIYEPEGQEGNRSGVSSSLPARLQLADVTSSDDEDFRPGELFAKHRLNASSSQDTGAQIRQATSQVLKNISDSSTKLVKTPISKNTNKRHSQANEACTNRQRDDLMYTDDDDRPHAKIDHIVQRHKDEKSKDEPSSSKKAKEKDEKKRDSSNDSFRKEIKKESQRANDEHKDELKREQRDDSNSKVARPEPCTSQNNNRLSDKKRPREEKQKIKAQELSSVMRGVVFVLSGYVNPQRAAYRQLAVSMHATPARDWGPACTHLICAFPNTPKFKQVRSSPGGAAVPIVRGEWVRECHKHRRLLPWRWFAADPRQAEDKDYGLLEGEAEQAEGNDDSGDECDTDDEIEKAMRHQKRRKLEDSPAASATTRMNESSSSDVAFVKDERLQGNVTVHDSDDDKTDEETEIVKKKELIAPNAALPDLFEGRTFVIDASAARANFDETLLQRYVRAYGGLVIDPSTLDEDTTVDYVLCTKKSKYLAGSATTVRPDWLWSCHAARALCSDDDYLVV